MKSPMNRSVWFRVFCLGFALPFFARGQSAPADTEVVSTTPMQFEVVGTGASGQLVVAPELTAGETRGDLTYTITEGPLFGRVGLAGGADEDDFYNNKTSRLG